MRACCQSKGWCQNERVVAKRGNDDRVRGGRRVSVVSYLESGGRVRACQTEGGGGTMRAF